MSRKRNKQYPQRVFESVLNRYRETKEAGYDGDMGQSHGIIRVSESDFICDVELAVEKTLDKELSISPNLKTFFLEFYLGTGNAERRKKLGEIVGTTAMKAARERLEILVGQEFLNREIYPFNRYREAIDVR